LDDILKDENMEIQTTWEDSSLAPLEVVEEGAIVAPHVRKHELDPIVQPKMEGQGNKLKLLPSLPP
jgi:nitrogen-specific signal transduction histidine kinase